MMLTSGPKRGTIACCQELDISAYLTKPVRQSQLRDALLKAMPARSKWGRAVAAPVTHRAHPVSQCRLRILLAEDNAINQRLALRLLEKCGHQVAVTTNGREALAAPNASGLASC